MSRFTRGATKVGGAADGIVLMCCHSQRRCARYQTMRACVRSSESATVRISASGCECYGLSAAASGLDIA